MKSESPKTASTPMKSILTIVVAVYLTLLVACSRGDRQADQTPVNELVGQVEQSQTPNVASETAPSEDLKTKRLFAGRFHFFYATWNDESIAEFENNEAIAIQSLPLGDVTFRINGLYSADLNQMETRKAYIALRKLTAKPPTAEESFYLAGSLQNPGQPTTISYRLLDARLDEKRIDCDLEFVYHSHRGGPGPPHNAFFVIEMPGLPSGDYTLNLDVTKSYYEKEGVMVEESPQGRGSLQRQIQFSILD